VTDPTDSSDVGSAAKIDKLERLLLNFIRSQQLGTATPEALDGAAYVEDGSAVENETMKLNSNASSGTRPAAAGMEVSRPTICIAADHRHASSVDQAHWALLMNEVSVSDMTWL
jgi:hypothetical protein